MTRLTSSEWSVTETFFLPFLREIVPSGLTYGAIYIVEFEPHSLWYETSLTLAASALRQGIRTDYHTHTHIPDEIRVSLLKLGLDVPRLEQQATLRIIDSYSVTTGLRQDKSQDSGENDFRAQSLDLRVWNEHYLRQIREGVPEIEKRRLHIDDNTSVLIQRNGEEFVLGAIKLIPWTRTLEVANVISWAVGAHSNTFVKQVESLSDGIIDFKSREESGKFEHYARVRAIRGKTFDSRWRHLRLLEIGEVVMDPLPLEIIPAEMVKNVSKVTLGTDSAIPTPSLGQVQFETEKAKDVFRLLAKEFLHDYMSKRLYSEKSGWRSLMDLVRESKLPRSAFYGPSGRKGPVLTELELRGLIETRIFPEERGRGGNVLKARVAYENAIVRKFVEQVAMES